MIYKSKTNRHFKWAYLALVPLVSAMTLYSCDKIQEEKASAETPANATHKGAIAFIEADQPPLFENCDASASHDDQIACFQTGIINYMIDNFEYPEKAKKVGLEGKIFLQFVINQEGTVEQVDVVRNSFPENSNLEAIAEAQVYSVKLVTKIPKMIPAIKDGKKVSVKFTLPINMKLK